MNHDKHEAHDENEGREDEVPADGVSRRYQMRLPSPLSPEAEHAMTETIGCAIRVHRALGPGFLESIYQKAMRAELAATGLSYESERPIRVKYRDIEIPGQRVDLIVERLVVVELKSVVRFDEIHRAQLLSYLRTTGLRGGLLVNFRVPVLHRGLMRVVL